jgi:hypothetical protein
MNEIKSKRTWATAEPRLRRHNHETPLRNERKSPHMPTQWPKIGGEPFRPAPTNAFLQEDFCDIFKPGETRGLYVAGCVGQRDLSVVEIAIPGYKVSSCRIDRLADRMFELNRDQYGALWHNGEDWILDDGWNTWFPSHLYPSQQPSPNSPVSARERIIAVTLPVSLAPAEFDRLIDREIRKGAFDLWSMTAEGRQHCAALGVNPRKLIRFTEYPGWRRIPAVELVAFSIYSGADRLISLAERVILEHLGLQCPAAPAAAAE